ncbi:hypothetical protein FJZ21_01690 [Candidatus Pacearchaeota archaeon]|nr:hypothetical protein [Candidatus Pacearchaeota archaeon]
MTREKYLSVRPDNRALYILHLGGTSIGPNIWGIKQWIFASLKLFAFTIMLFLFIGSLRYISADYFTVYFILGLMLLLLIFYFLIIRYSISKSKDYLNSIEYRFYQDYLEVYHDPKYFLSPWMRFSSKEMSPTKPIYFRYSEIYSLQRKKLLIDYIFGTESLRLTLITGWGKERYNLRYLKNSETVYRFILGKINLRV